ncbi:MAG: ArsA family ATPase [Desulfobacterales bacterium]|nr:ArsA family ATPase [Desulfobacterales bacterium]
MNLFDSIEKKQGPRIIICCGSGGVGKTTISASIGLHAALCGLKTMVLTIDPAKRLADSLGITSFDFEMQQVPIDKLTVNSPKNGGELYAMMLDSKRTFDKLIMRYATSDVQELIYKNRYYQHISKNFAGSHEYMAMEKLYELYKENQYDLIVLDTPPTRQALDFLKAPQRLIDLLGHNLFWKLFRPYFQAGKIGFRMLSAVASPILRVTGQVMGTQVLDDVSDFFRLWNDMLFEGFRERAMAVKELLSGPQSTFMIITSPMRVPMIEAIVFYKKLIEHRIPFGGFVVNRVHPLYIQDIDDIFQLSEFEDWDDTLKNRLFETYQNFQKLGQSDLKAIDDLKNIIGKYTEVREIPFFETDVYNFDGLLKIRNNIFQIPTE